MALEENISKQIDEIEALSAIYEDDWEVIDEGARKFSVKIGTKCGHVATLQVTLVAEYPSDTPPLYEFSMPWLRGAKRLEVDKALNDIYVENSGESIIYMWVEKLRGIVMGETSNNEELEEDDPDEINEEADFNPQATELSNSTAENFSACECPEIFHGDFLTDRKSKFQAHLAQVHYKEQVGMVLDKLCENKKIAAATHNIYAFRIYREDSGKKPMAYQGCEDDGEIHAGNRMLHLLQIIDCQNVMVVVTRWYGGIHLGPDRFKHINNLARSILEEHGYIRDSKKEKKSGKKK